MNTRLHLALAAAATAVCFAAAPAGAAAPPSYGYPVAPFHREHPVRGYFGDPRTLFDGPPTAATVARGSGRFQFHDGVDISAPNGTAVYPVASGVVTAVSKTEDWWIEIRGAGGISFQYWHVTPAVAVGRRVTAYRTLLGHVRRPAGHVHLTELVGGRPVNPLAPGRLGPFTDSTRPRVNAILFRSPETGEPVLPAFVRGGVELAADTADVATVPVPGPWHGLPTMPALVTWRIQSWTGRVVVPETAAVDFRDGIPAAGAFWSVYARGTYQNMCVFGPHYSYVQPGRYLVRLGHGPLDTTRLRDGVYDLVVTAVDVRGNRGSSSVRFTVHNRDGWVGS